MDANVFTTDQELDHAGASAAPVAPLPPDEGPKLDL